MGIDLLAWGAWCCVVVATISAVVVVAPGFTFSSRALAAVVLILAL